MKTGSIYIIKNKINDKVYVGQTTMTVHERFMSHMKPSVSKKRSSYKLYMAINKYGSENFYVETLEGNIPIEELDEKEILYISKYDSFYNGYNSTKGGDGRVINLIENESDVLEKARAKVPATELAKEYDVNVATIYRTLHKLGFYYNDTDEESIIVDVLAGMKQYEVAKKYGVDKITVQRTLRKHNVRLHKESVDKRESFDVEKIKQDYLNQMSIKEICQKYNISNTTFYRIKDNYSFPTRKQIYTNITQRADIEAIRHDYLSGMKVVDICKKYSLSNGNLYRIINENNFGKRKHRER